LVDIIPTEIILSELILRKQLSLSQSSTLLIYEKIIMKVSNIKTTIDGVNTSNLVRIEMPDVRFPLTGNEVTMTLEEANILLEMLSKKLSTTPF
jgi:hypothetical protein